MLALGTTAFLLLLFYDRQLRRGQCVGFEFGEVVDGGRLLCRVGFCFLRK